MMDEEIRQALSEVREMKKMCGNINMKLTNIVTQRGQGVKKKLEAEYQRGFEDGKAVHEKGCEGCEHECENKMTQTCILCCNAYKNRWIAKSDKIEVGDEVFDIPTKTKGILLEPETEHLLATVIIPSQRWRTFNASHVNLKKTGKHYDIEKLLEAMEV